MIFILGLAVGILLGFFVLSNTFDELLLKMHKNNTEKEILGEKYKVIKVE